MALLITVPQMVPQMVAFVGCRSQWCQRRRHQTAQSIMLLKCCGDPGGEPDANCVPAGDSCGPPLQSTVADLPPCHQCLRGWSTVDRGCDAPAYDAARCQQCCEENGCTTCPSQAPAVAATTKDLARTYGVAIGIPLGSAVVFAFGYTIISSPR